MDSHGQSKIYLLFLAAWPWSSTERNE